VRTHTIPRGVRTAHSRSAIAFAVARYGELPQPVATLLRAWQTCASTALTENAVVSRTAAPMMSLFMKSPQQERRPQVGRSAAAETDPLA